MEVKEIKIYKFSATFTAWLALALLLVTLLTYIIAIATPAWGVVNITQGNYVVSGLWIRCEHYSGYQTCHSLVGTEGVSSKSFFLSKWQLSEFGIHKNKWESSIMILNFNFIDFKWHSSEYNYIYPNNLKYLALSGLNLRKTGQMSRLLAIE